MTTQPPPTISDTFANTGIATVLNTLAREEEENLMDQMGAFPVAFARTPNRDVHGLTPGQWRVIHALDSNGTRKEVAARLYISERTLNNHIVSILRILGLPCRTAIVRWLRDRREKELREIVKGFVKAINYDQWETGLMERAEQLIES